MTNWNIFFKCVLDVSLKLQGHFIRIGRTVICESLSGHYLQFQIYIPNRIKVVLQNMDLHTQ